MKKSSARAQSARRGTKESRYVVCFKDNKLRPQTDLGKHCLLLNLRIQPIQVYTLNPFDAPSTEKKQIRCTICKTMEKSILYACESEHVVCKSCQSSEKEFDLDTDISPLKKPEPKVTDLPGGDPKGDLLLQEPISKNDVEITMEYKNPNFQESKTTVSTKITESKEVDEEETCDVIHPRPVVCPVTSCSKIVTIDSFLLHFLFDHSKVPRATLDDTTPQEVILKSANFSMELQCLATFIMETQKRPSQTIKNNIELPITRNAKKDNKLLLLLTVRLPTSPIKLPNVKCDPSAIFTRSIHTQTEKDAEHLSGISAECLSKNGGSDYKTCTSGSVLDEDEVLLLWLCKLDDAVRVFSITLLGEDKRRGYCYIGDAIHVRDKQDPSLLYERSECLIVKGSAINQLYDPQGQITAIVSLIG